MPRNDETEYSPEPRRPLGPWLLKAGTVALLVVALVAGSVNLLVPRVTSRAGTELRTGWYLRSKQWVADARTVFYVVKFVLERVPSLRLSQAKNPATGTNTLAVDLAQTNNLAAVPTA
jgi:hypothetical protein